MFLLKNSQGRPDFLMTAATLTLAAVLVKVILNGAVVVGIACGTIDPSLVGALLVPTLTAYTAKRIKLPEGK